MGAGGGAVWANSAEVSKMSLPEKRCASLVRKIMDASWLLNPPPPPCSVPLPLSFPPPPAPPAPPFSSPLPFGLCARRYGGRPAEFDTEPHDTARGVLAAKGPIDEAPPSASRRSASSPPPCFARDCALVARPLGRGGKARWYGERPVHHDETLAPKRCVAERGVFAWSEPCRREPARGDKVTDTLGERQTLVLGVRQLLGDRWPRSGDIILHVLIGAPERDEMPDSRVCGDNAAARIAGPPGGPKRGECSASCQLDEAAAAVNSGRPPTHGRQQTHERGRER